MAAASGGKGDAKGAKDPAEATSPAASNAVDGLTPPTMKYGPNDGDGERTQIGPAPSSSNIAKPGSSTGSKMSGSATITGDLTGSAPSHSSATSIGAQDLSGERLLRDAPRIESGGLQCPSLNGIPLMAKIGQGGMGAVYFGVHPRLQSEVAVKVLPFHLAEQDPGMIKRFFREAQIAAMVRSPHLVNVMDVNEESGLFFLVMEYVAGKTAGQYLKLVIEGGQMGIPELEALDISIAATIGLQAAHNNNIVHRDLKPENIMVPYLNRNSAKEFDLRRSKLMDLGLARNEESNQSLTGVQAAMGTPGYMAPEQALDAKTADKRSDIFGMGATMYALLIGKPPFRGEAIMKVLMATMHEPHEPVIKIRPEISQTFSEIIDKCLDKKQDNRFSDATQLLRALRHCRRQIAPAADDDDDEGGGDVGVIPGMSVARQPAAGGARTIITGSGSGSEQTLISSGQQAKSKTGLIVAAAAAGLILVGGVGYAVFGSKSNTGSVVSSTVTGQSTGTGTGKPADPGLKLTDKMLNLQKGMHANNLKLAEESARAGDLDSASNFLLTAQSLPVKQVNDPQMISALEKDERRVQSIIEGAGKTIKFNEKMTQVDGYIKKEDLAKAKSELDLATALAVEDSALKALQEKQNLLTFLKGAETKKKAFIDILNKSAEVLKNPQNVNDEAMKNLNEALSKLPSDSDRARLQREAAYLIPSSDEFEKLQKKFSAVLDDRQKNDQYELLLKQSKETTDLEKKASFLQQAIDLNLERNEAKVAKLDVDNQLGAEKVKARDQQRKTELRKEFDAALSEAKSLQEKQDFDKALAALNKGLAKIPDDPVGKSLEKDLTTAIADKKKHADFNALLQAASGAIDDNDTASAEKNLADARKIFTTDPALTKVEQALASAKDRFKRRKEFDGYAMNARKAIGDNDAAKAQEFLDKAIAIDPKGAGLDGVRDFLLQKKAEAAAAQTKIENFKKYMDDAAKLETGLEAKPLEQQVADLKKALENYSSARAYSPDNDTSAGEKITAVKAKIETASAAFEKEKAVAAAKARIESLKKDFDTKFTDISKTATAKPDDALASLTALRAQLTDKDAFKTELGKIDAKLAEVNKVVSDLAEGKYKAAMQQIKDRLTAKELNGALTALRSVPAAFANQQDVKDVSAALGSIQTISSDINTLVTRSAARLAQLDRSLRGKGEPEKARYNAAVASIQALPLNAMSQLSQANLKDTNVTATLKREKDRIADDIGNALDRLDVISRQRDPEPVKEPPRNDPPPKKNGGSSVGEQNVDD
jgi:serine/threonine protein kinase